MAEVVRVSGLARQVRRWAEGVGPGPRAWLVDGALVVGQLAIAILLGAEPPPGPWHPLDVLGALLVALTVLPLAVRRRWPWGALGACCAAWTALIAAGYWPVIGCYGPILAVYTVAACRGARGAAGAVLLTASAWVYAGFTTPHSSMKSVLVQAAVVPAVVAFVGLQSHRLQDRNRRLEELTVLLRREQLARAENAVAAERLRIARELHDVVAHHLSVVSVQSGLATYVFDNDPPTAREALGAIALASTEALEEMRGLLQLLRARPDTVKGPEPSGAGRTVSASPPPGLSRLAELVERVRSAGLSARLLETGQQRPLTEGVELCAYRIVQEALTNTLKHAGSTDVVVTLHYGPALLVGRIVDDGPRRGGIASPRPEPLPGTRQGLIGMHERVRIHGGTLHAEPRRSGGFEVIFTLPATAPGRRGPGPVHQADGGADDDQDCDS